MQHFFVHITWFQMCILEILLLPEERVHFSSDCNMQFGSMVVQILSIVFCTVKTMIDCMRDLSKGMIPSYPRGESTEANNGVNVQLYAQTELCDFVGGGLPNNL